MTNRMTCLPPDPLFRLRADMDHIHSLCFLEEEGVATVLLAATQSGFIYFWDLETNRLKFKKEIKGTVLTIHVFGSDLVAQCKDGNIYLWHSERYDDLSPNKCFRCEEGFCKSFAFDHYLLVPMKNAIGIVDVNNMELIKSLKVPKRDLGQLMAIHRFVWSEGGAAYVLGGFESGYIMLWDVEEEAIVGELQLKECITSLTYDAEKGRGICVGVSKKLWIFEIDYMKHMTLTSDISIMNEGLNLVKLRDDKKLFVTGGWDGRLRMFSWKSLKPLTVLKEHKMGVTDVQFSNFPAKGWNKKIVAAASADGTITLWSLYN